jgi:biopolymer transport protein ExbD
MAMSIGANHEGPMMEINTTPLIDVMLVLLIMLIITLPAMTHAVKLDLPYGGTAQESDNIAVMIDFDGTVVWDGAVVATLSELERNMRAISRANPQPTISVRADRRAQYDTVAHVLATAQRNGLQRIAIEGSP